MKKAFLPLIQHENKKNRDKNTNRTYDLKPCCYCGVAITTAGAGYYNHMKTHVDNKQCVMVNNGVKNVYYRAITDIPEICTIFEEPIHIRKHETERTLTIVQDRTRRIIPNDSLPKMVDPASYFITSGDAVDKAEKLVSDAYALAVECKTLLNVLHKVKANALYLEVTRKDGEIVVRKIYTKGDHDSNEYRTRSKARSSNSEVSESPSAGDSEESGDLEEC